ncbi:hypothetical protein AAFF_G00243880 [Aldrovandia affinis]|uniref:Uncharacterized protein n=1 Tax=Aldrovandia affinis TaxID=143900 RepID=A0AAD7RDX2_9TELE|nr:hypothetical protein AAFF_G00243880 [Aldrovandia affinis]
MGTSARRDTRGTQIERAVHRHSRAGKLLRASVYRPALRFPVSASQRRQRSCALLQRPRQKTKQLDSQTSFSEEANEVVGFLLAAVRTNQISAAPVL